MDTTARAAVLAAIRERRSIRKFSDQPVAATDIRVILEAGRWAPSGLNNQPWRFLVVLPDDPRHQALAACTKYDVIVLHSGALICVFLEKSLMYHPMKDYQGAGACIQNLLLATHALGLGAVWLGEIVNQAPRVFETLGLDPEQLELMAVLALGHPATKGHSSRHELDEFLLEAF